MATDISDVALIDGVLSAPASPLDSGAGAVVDFLGVVRGLEGHSHIAGIAYEAHREMAEHQMRKIAAAAQEKYTLRAVTLHHRLGFVPAAEASLFVRVMAAHRGPAFDGCRWIIERLKEAVPIWKRPIPCGPNR